MDGRPFVLPGAQCVTHHCLNCRVRAGLAGHKELFRSLPVYGAIAIDAVAVVLRAAGQRMWL